MNEYRLTHRGRRDSVRWKHPRIRVWPRLLVTRGVATVARNRLDWGIRRRHRPIFRQHVGDLLIHQKATREESSDQSVVRLRIPFTSHLFGHS